AGASESSAASRPHVSLIVPAETFAALREHHRTPAPRKAGRRDAAESPVLADDDAPSFGQPGGPALDGADDRAETGAWFPVVPATLEDGTPVAMSELAQALCDCEITRIVVSAEGVPLDLGRTKRTYAGVHRRAVVARDRQCAWNG